MLRRVCFVFFAACSLQLTVADNSTNFQFPGPTNAQSRSGGDPCEGKTFCTIKPDNYPQEFFDNLFKGKIKELNQPTLVVAHSQNREEYDLIADNCGGIITYEPLYQVRTDPQSDWYMVAQSPKNNYRQVVRVETCTLAGEPCFSRLTAVDKVAFCRQQLSTWEFLVYDGNENTKKLKVALPSCCTCYYMYIE